MCPSKVTYTYKTGWSENKHGFISRVPGRVLSCDGMECVRAHRKRKAQGSTVSLHRTKVNSRSPLGSATHLVSHILVLIKWHGLGVSLWVFGCAGGPAVPSCLPQPVSLRCPKALSTAANLGSSHPVYQGVSANTAQGTFRGTTKPYFATN